MFTTFSLTGSLLTYKTGGISLPTPFMFYKFNAGELSGGWYDTKTSSYNLTKQSGNTTTQINTSDQRVGSGCMEMPPTCNAVWNRNPNISVTSSIDTTGIAMQYWIKTPVGSGVAGDGMPSTSNNGFCIYFNSSPFGINIHFYGNKLSINMTHSDGSQYGNFISSADVCTNSWNHIAVTVTGTTWLLYINGALDTTYTASSTPYNNYTAGTYTINDFKIGYVFGGGGAVQTGYDVKMDNYSLYTSALTALDVANLYNSPA